MTTYPGWTGCQVIAWEAWTDIAKARNLTIGSRAEWLAWLAFMGNDHAVAALRELDEAERNVPFGHYRQTAREAQAVVNQIHRDMLAGHRVRRQRRA